MNASQEAQLWQDIGGLKADVAAIRGEVGRLLDRANGNGNGNSRKAPLIAGGLGGAGTLGFAVAWVLERFAGG